MLKNIKNNLLFYLLMLILLLIISYNIIGISKIVVALKFMVKISPIFILGTLIIGINQLRLNQKQQKNTKEWNKKQLAITQIHKSRNKIIKILKKLDKYFKSKNIKSITDRQKNEPFTLKEIHQLIGNGEYKPNGNFEFDKKGEKVRRLLLEFLGEYEYIAAATNSDIFDRQVVKDILQYNIIRTYYVFENYIKHIREIHANNNSIYIELEKLAKKLENNP